MSNIPEIFALPTGKLLSRRKFRSPTLSERLFSSGSTKKSAP